MERQGLLALAALRGTDTAASESHKCRHQNQRGDLEEGKV